MPDLPRGRPAGERGPAPVLTRRLEASLAATLAGDLGAAAGAEADELLLRLANELSNADFLGLCRTWAVETALFRRLLSEID